MQSQTSPGICREHSQFRFRTTSFSCWDHRGLDLWLSLAWVWSFDHKAGVEHHPLPCMLALQGKRTRLNLLMAISLG